MTANSLKWTLAALIVGSPAAMALGLGDIHLHSSLNAPLDADIDLIGATADDLANLKAQVAPRETFQQQGLDWPAFLSTVTLKPMHTSDGRDILKVHSGVAITEPFVTILVELNWARGHVTHEYTVLLDPPVFTPDQGQAAAAAPSVATPAVGAATRAGAIQREPAAPAPAPALPPPAAPAPTTAPVATSGQTYRVQRGDTLSRIAAHESTATSQPEVRRWMVAAYEGNLDAFDKNMNLLRTGAVLRMPDATALGAVSSSDALAEVRRQYAAWHSGAPVTPSAPGTSASSDTGRLRLVTPGTAAGTATAAGSAAAAAESKALQGKVQQLQSQLDESQRLLAVRNADLAKLQAQLAAAKAGAAAAPAAATPAPAAPAPTAPPTAAPATPAPTETAAAPPATPAVTADQTSAPSEAVASAPVVKHHPQNIAPVIDQSGGSITDLLAKYWWALALLVAAIAGFFGLRAWRERRQSSFDDSLGHLTSRTDATGEHETNFDTQPLVPLRAESILVEESGSHAKPRLDSGARAPHISADQTISAETAVNLDQGDPLAEADFHMAYGLYDQAADLVRIAIARDPTRRDLKLKLLEVFFVWGNKEQFLNSARELASTRAEAAPGEWEKILIMGKQLAPEDPLFAAGSAVSGAAAAGVDLDLEGGQTSDIDFDVIGSPTAIRKAADDIDLDIGTAIGERDPMAEQAASQATDKNLALHGTTQTTADLGATGSTQEMTQGRMAQARFGGLNDGVTQESPTIEQPLASANGATVRQKVEKVMQQNAHDQTAELAIDDLGLDLNSLDTVDQPALGAGSDAPTMVAGLDEHSRRLLETAEQRNPSFNADPSETPTGSWQFDGSATDAPISIEGAEHDIGATASLAALSSDLDFNIGLPEEPAPRRPADANGHHGLDLDVGTATVPDAAFAQTQKLGTEDLALPDLEPVTMSEVGTKLDLARAYMDMGDPEGARNILEEVVTEGSVAQKQEAQRLIESLPG